MAITLKGTSTVLIKRRLIFPETLSSRGWWEKDLRVKQKIDLIPDRENSLNDTVIIHETSRDGSEDIVLEGQLIRTNLICKKHGIGWLK